MSGRFAEPAEVARCGGDAPAKVVLPDAVDDDAGGEWIVRAGEPVGQHLAPPGGGRAGRDFGDLRLCWVKDGEEAGIDGGVACAAAFESRLSGLAAGLADDEGGEQGIGLEVVELRERLARGPQFGELGFLDLVLLEAHALVVCLAPGELDHLLLVGGALLARLAPHGLHLVGEFLHGVSLRGGDARLDDAVYDGQRLFGRRAPGGVPRVPGADFLRRGQGLVLGPGDVRKEGLEAVVIVLEDGVELVVVALRALHAHAHEHIRCDAGDLVQDVLPLGLRITLVVLVDGVAEKCGADGDFRVLRVQLVARDLLAHELVVGFVAVEGLDDVVAVGPGIRTIGVEAVALGLGIAGEVQPVLRPALAVARGGEQLINEALVGAGAFGLGRGFVRLNGRSELRYFLWRGRQAVQVKIDSPGQLLRGRLRGGSQPVFLQLGEDEGVYGIADFVLRIADCGQRRSFHWLEGPPGAVFLGELPGLARGLGGGDLGLGPGRAHGDPLFEDGDFFVGEFAIGRHLQIRVRVGDRFDEQGGVRLVRHHGGAAFAALPEVGQIVHAQAAFLLFVGVAFVAGLRQ